MPQPTWQTALLWLRRNWRPVSWTVIAVAGVATLVLGVYGFSTNAAEQTPPVIYPFSTVLYLTLQLFVLNSGGVAGPVNWELEVARFAGALVGLCTVAKLIATLAHERFRDFQLHFRRGHAVLCGMGRRGRRLAEDFLAEERLNLVIIERDRDNPYLKAVVDLGASVLYADAADERILRKANVLQARYLAATTSDDGTNLRIACIAGELARSRREGTPPLRCYVHLFDARLLDLVERRRAVACGPHCEIRVFNVFDNAARALFDEHPLDRRVVRAGDPRWVHLVIIGCGQLGEALLLRAARIGQFANHSRLRVTVIDPRAAQKRKTLEAGYPGLGQVCDLAFLEGTIEDPPIRCALEDLARDPQQIVSVAVCPGDDHRALSCALHLPAEVGRRRVPVYVRLSDPEGIARLLQDPATTGDEQLYCFGSPEDACRLERVLRPGIDELARQIHEDYRRKALAALEAQRVKWEESDKTEPCPEPTPAMRPWPQLSESYRDSNREQAEHIVRKLAAIGCRKVKPEAAHGTLLFRFAEPEVEILARMEHDRWCASKWLSGWRPGPRSDAEKTHPDLVPWETLDDQTREKDRDPVRAIPALVAALGEVIERENA